VVATAAGLAAGVCPAVASAEETYSDSRVGPQFALIRTGQIEDPLEHLLERVSVLSETNGIG
jgi:hypothetical protein